MIDEISLHLRRVLNNFNSEDSLIYNNRIITISKNNFSPLPSIYSPEWNNKSVAFIDGGQAEIISAGNFCLSFIRVGALIFQGNKKIKDHKQEFYLLTTGKYYNQDLFYESKIFGDKMIEEADLLISSTDSSIKSGLERAPVSKVANMARRFAELSLAEEIDADFVVLDGILEPTFKNEEKYLLGSDKICSIAKSSSLFTVSGNSPVVLLNKLGPQDCWSYLIDNDSHFVKLNERGKHVFRFMGDKAVLPFLKENSQDALFLGYPYGLIAVDRFVRVSNEEKNSLRIKFLLREENKEITEYLNTSNAHDLLDNLG
ncbi:MAG: hypothetical protein KKA62_00550 [Nanoarchaeota archaeon]|nr:hypothetical protein [Nanoarchaeota archaeon]MBU1644390.1 hypothetical protein [Nanoarchaeota archaeon]MBU1976423.1 hypothetical protein [Nanoarchaeota archaeon]